jgi:hypothetical protein
MKCQTNWTTHANKSKLSSLVIGLNHQVGKRKPCIVIIFVHSNRNGLKYLYMMNFQCTKSDFLAHIIIASRINEINTFIRKCYCVDIRLKCKIIHSGSKQGFYLHCCNEKQARTLITLIFLHFLKQTSVFMPSELHFYLQSELHFYLHLMNSLWSFSLFHRWLKRTFSIYKFNFPLCQVNCPTKDKFVQFYLNLANARGELSDTKNWIVIWP